MFEFMNLIKALSDESRLRILMALRDRELCVCQMTAFLDLAPSTTSKHLSILRQARLIESEKHGKWVYYHLAETVKTSKAIEDALNLVRDSLGNSRVILDDESRIQRILTSDNRAGCPDVNQAFDSEQEEMHSAAIHALDDAFEAELDSGMLVNDGASASKQTQAKKMGGGLPGEAAASLATQRLSGKVMNLQ